MPIVQITMIEGRSDEQKQAMYHEITEAIHRTTDTPREAVRIMIYEVPPRHFATAGKSKSGPSSPPAGAGTSANNS
jgi:4-oxalocrotonate tautomerase